MMIMIMIRRIIIKSYKSYKKSYQNHVKSCEKHIKSNENKSKSYENHIKSNEFPEILIKLPCGEWWSDMTVRFI